MCASSFTFFRRRRPYPHTLNVQRTALAHLSHRTHHRYRSGPCTVEARCTTVYHCLMQLLATSSPSYSLHAHTLHTRRHPPTMTPPHHFHPFHTVPYRHHCRVCGQSVCDAHSKTRGPSTPLRLYASTPRPSHPPHPTGPVAGFSQPQRICNQCVAQAKETISYK